jgi:hypothetical protein
MDVNTKLAQLLLIYKDDPILAIEQLFGITPDKQQTQLILEAKENNCRIAVKSSQGAGKTACLAWLTMLYLLTLEDCRILVSSPSYQQLSRIYHTEVIKWHSKMPPMFKDFFEITKERVSIKGKPEQFASLVTANPGNLESLQGLHAENVIILVDEASGVEKEVWEVFLGTLGFGKTKLIATSNPIRSSGFFYDIFSKKIGKWKRITFNAMDSALSSEEWIEEMGDTYQTDSDIYSIRVLGEFGRLSEEQFIPTDIVEHAISAHLDYNLYHNYPIVTGVDVARYGVDKTVFVTRQGPKIIDVSSYSQLNNMEVVGKLVEYRNIFNLSVIFIDAIGTGSGVYDRAKELRLPVKEVVVSTKSSEPHKYFNMRSQLWGYMRDWLENGADIPLNDSLRSELIAMTYGFSGKMQIQMGNKKDMKKRGLASPDHADALSLTFADRVYGNTNSSTLPRKIRRNNFLWI